MLQHVLDIATNVLHAVNIFVNAVLVFCCCSEIF